MSTTQPEALRENHTAADMATAAAQGFRDGVASVAAGAGSEPVAIYHGRCVIDCGAHGHLDMELLKMIPAGTKLYTHPSPPEGMVGGWQDIATVPKDGSEVLVNATGIGRVVVYWSDDESQWGTGLGYLDRETPTHWMPLPPRPTNPAGSGKGE